MRRTIAIFGTLLIFTAATATFAAAARQETDKASQREAARMMEASQKGDFRDLSCVTALGQRFEMARRSGDMTELQAVSRLMRDAAVAEMNRVASDKPDARADSSRRQKPIAVASMGEPTGAAPSVMDAMSDPSWRRARRYEIAQALNGDEPMAMNDPASLNRQSGLLAELITIAENESGRKSRRQR